MELSEFFSENPRAVLAFSGGVDSSYLLYEALQNHADIHACYVRTNFQPVFEYDDAMRMADFFHMKLVVISSDVLTDPQISNNPKDRCYYCKKRIFDEIQKYAEENSFPLILDGTNASDNAGDRPGMRVLREMGVRSPLRECGMTKDMIRIKSKEAGLFTWSKPAYACLATRIQTGIHLTKENLARTERAEDYLHQLGFVDFRVRMTVDDAAIIQIHGGQRPLFLETRPQMVAYLKCDYSAVYVDFEERDKASGGLSI